MEPPKHPFERFFTRSQQQLHRRNEFGYETRLINFLLKELRLTRRRSELLEMQQRRTTDLAPITLAVFNDAFPEFPLVMACSRLQGKRLHICVDTLLPNLFKNYQRAPYVKHYDLEAYQRFQHTAQGRTIGLIFPYKGVPKSLVVHNGGLDQFRYPGTVITHHQDDESEPRTLYVQSLAPLVRAIAQTDWQNSQT